MTTYLLAGGGTAGHVNPLLATADELQRRHPDATILVLGTAEGLEAELVPARGYELLTIPKLPFPRRVQAKALAFPVELNRIVSHVRSLITARGVDVVVGFGGYAAAPAYLAARREHVPYVIHEANARPGMANKMARARAAAVTVAFPGTPLKGAELVGMPLRPEIAALAEARAADQDADLVATGRRRFDLDDRPVLLVTGGSLGARQINQALTASAAAIVDAGWQVVHIAGARNDVYDPDVDGYHLLDYCNHMQDALAIADLAISRSGASTVSELSALGVPTVYVPYPHGNGEQALNAQPALDAGAALLVADAEITPEWVGSDLLTLLADDARRQSLRDHAKGFGIVDGAQRLAEVVDRVAGVSA